MKIRKSNLDDIIFYGALSNRSFKSASLHNAHFKVELNIAKYLKIK